MLIKVKKIDIIKEFEVEVEGETFIFKIVRNGNRTKYFIDNLPYDSKSAFHEQFMNNWPNSFLI